MSKYKCLDCWIDFRTKRISDLHRQMFPDHLMAKVKWKARFLDWFFNLPGHRITRFIGGFMIYFVLIHHFKIDWSIWEATFIGVGMGLYIE